MLRSFHPHLLLATALKLGVVPPSSSNRYFRARPRLIYNTPFTDCPQINRQQLRATSDVLLNSQDSGGLRYHFFHADGGTTPIANG